MKYIPFLFIFFLVPDASAQRWIAGAGYTGINFDNEVLPYGIYTHADRQLVGDLFSTWHFSWQTDRQKDEVLTLRESLFAILTGPMYVFEFGGRSVGENPSVIFTSLMFGFEHWRITGEARPVPPRRPIDLSSSTNGWASQITLGLSIPVTQRLSVNVSSAYRAKWYNINGTSASLNDFVWYAGVSTRF